MVSLSHAAKLRLDRTAGVALARLFKGAAIVLASVLKRDHGVPDAPRCVAVAKIMGLGSAVYSSSLCRGLKSRWPGTRVIYITGRDNAALVERMSAVDEVLVLDDRTALSIVASGARIVWTLWRRRPALYFDLEVYSSLAAILATLSLAVNRYGFYRKSAGFKRGLHTHTVFFNAHRHIEDIYGQMLSCVGGKLSPGTLGAIELRPEDRAERGSKLAERGLTGKRLVLINPNASELMLERRWPRELWARFLTAAIERHPDLAWALVGAGHERDYVEGILRETPSASRAAIRNLAGELSLGGFLALIEGASLLVTSDSGPLHAAAALGCPTVSLWGPGAPEHYMPRAGAHEAVYAQTYCSPCLYHADFPPCEGDNVCMKRTPVETVLSATERILDRTGRAQPAEINLWRLDLREFGPTILP